MLIDNRPFTNENGWVDNGFITDLSEDVVATVLEWIDKELTPRKTFNPRHTSYGLKHYLERATGIYLTNNQFKDAMLLKNYYPRDVNHLNWEYRISEKSPAFKRKIT